MRHILLCTQYDLDECTPIGLVAYFIGWGMVTASLHPPSNTR